MLALCFAITHVLQHPAGPSVNSFSLRLYAMLKCPLLPAGDFLLYYFQCLAAGAPVSLSLVEDRKNCQLTSDTQTSPCVLPMLLPSQTPSPLCMPEFACLVCDTSLVCKPGMCIAGNMYKVNLACLSKHMSGC